MTQPPAGGYPPPPEQPGGYPPPGGQVPPPAPSGPPPVATPAAPGSGRLSGPRRSTGSRRLPGAPNPDPASGQAPPGGYPPPPQGGYPPPGGYQGQPQGGFAPPPQGGYPPPGYGAPAAAAKPSVDLSKVSIGDWIVLGIGVLMIIFGTFGWISVSTPYGGGSTGGWHIWWIVIQLLLVAVVIIRAVQVLTGQLVTQIPVVYLVYAAVVLFVLYVIALIQIFVEFTTASPLPALWRGSVGGYSTGPGIRHLGVRDPVDRVRLLHGTVGPEGRREAADEGAGTGLLVNRHLHVERPGPGGPGLSMSRPIDVRGPSARRHRRGPAGSAAHRTPNAGG